MYAAPFAPLSNKESNIFALIMKSRDVVWQCVVYVSMHGYLTLYVHWEIGVYSYLLTYTSYSLGFHDEGTVHFMKHKSKRNKVVYVCKSIWKAKVY